MEIKELVTKTMGMAYQAQGAFSTGHPDHAAAYLKDLQNLLNKELVAEESEPCESSESSGS